MKIISANLKAISRWNPSAKHLKEVEQERKRFREEKIIFPNTATDKTYAKDRLNGLRQLMKYRMMCNVPYKHLRLSPLQNAYADAASIICKKINRLSHTPKNPGFAKDFYDFCYFGTTHSNLSMNSRGTQGWTSIDSFMDDSDQHNLDRVGHRRWCLNPLMGTCGVGSVGNYGALYCFDKSGPQMQGFPQDYDFDFVAFPANGYMPASDKYFKNFYAWSVSYNKFKYNAPDPDQVKAKIYKATARQCKAKTLEPKGEPIELRYNKLNTGLFGSGPCMIFLPKSIKIRRGSCFIVVIEGLTDREGNPTTIKYPVMFF